jgi:hypothetical protein
MSTVISKKEERLNYLYQLGKLSKPTYWAEREFNWRPMTNKNNGKQAWYQYLLLGCFDNSYTYPDDYFEEKLRGKPIQKFAWRIGRQSGKTEVLSVGALFLALCRPIHYTIPRRGKDPALIGTVKPDGTINTTGWTEFQDPYVRGAKIIVGSADADKARTIFERVMKFIAASDKLSAAMEEGTIVKKLHPFPELVFNVAGWTEPASITFRGPGAGGQTARSKTFDYKLYDECDYMPPIFFEAEKATSINAGEHGLVILSSTPTGKREHFYNACFTEDAPVNMADGTFKKIKDVEVGDVVINRFGKPAKVIKTMNRLYDGFKEGKYRGKVISFMTTLNDTIVTSTSNHKFMSLRKGERFCKLCSKYIWSNSDKCVLRGGHGGYPSVVPKYHKINELDIGDYIAVPLSAVKDPENVFLGHIDGDFLYVPIKQYEDVYDTVQVYNLTVEDDHSYCVNNYGVANCTKPDWHYQEFHIPSKENPNFTPEFNQEFLNEHPRSVYEHEIEASWGTVEEGVFDWTYFEWVFRAFDEKINASDPEKSVKTPTYRIFNTEYNRKRKPFPDEYECINLTPSDISKIGHSNLGNWLRSKFPIRTENRKYWFGADLGYQSDPSEFVVFEEWNGVMKLILRIHMEHIPYLTQCDIIALLDNFYMFELLGMDQGSNGLMVEQVLKATENGHNKFKNHNFPKRLFAVNFSNKVQVSNKFNGETVLVPVKQFMTDCIIMAAQNKMLMMPGVDIDDDIENQFRNHTYQTGSGGTIIYSKSTVFPDHVIDACRTAFFAKSMAKIPKGKPWPTGSAFKARGAGGWR